MTEKDAEFKINVTISIYPLWVAGWMYTAGVLITSERFLDWLSSMTKLEAAAVGVGTALVWPAILGIMSGL